MLVVEDWKQNGAAGLYLQCAEKLTRYHEVVAVRFRVSLVLLAVGMSLANAAAQHTTGGATAKAVPAITVTEQDNGRDVDLNAGDTLIVRLPSNPTTGYNWSVAGEPAPLKLRKSTFHKKPGNGNAVGAGGTSLFHFTATSSGIANLTLVYRRSWEYNVPPLKTFSVRVNVR